MKKLIIAFALLLSAMSGFSQQWTFLDFLDQRINAVAVHPENPQIVFCAGTGIYKSTDGGSTWDTVSLYTGFNSIYFHPENPDTIYATLGMETLSDGIYRSVDGGDNWDVMAWMPGVKCVLIPFWPQGNMLAGTMETGVLTSSDYGATWTGMNDSLDNTNVLCIEAAYPSCIPEDPINLYLIGTEGGVFYYPEHTWLDSPEEYWHNTNTGTNATIPAISVAESGNYLWTVVGEGSYSSGMYNSINMGALWFVSEYWPFATDIQINMINPTTVYASDSTYGVKRTVNNGANWYSINENLGDSLVYCIAQSPSDTLHLYAGTEHGLWVYNFATEISENEQEFENDFVVFPNPADEFIEISDINTGLIEIINSQGQIVKSVNITGKAEKIDVSSLLSGYYIIKIETDHKTVFRKMIR